MAVANVKYVLLICIVKAIQLHETKKNGRVTQNKMRYLLKFENGKEVISNDQSYITLITWEKMFESKIVSNTPIY